VLLRRNMRCFMLVDVIKTIKTLCVSLIVSVAAEM
jgi:hypothetical protein